MHAFVVLGLVFFILSQETVLGKHLRNDLFCVERDVKPQLRQSVSVVGLVTGHHFYKHLNTHAIYHL